MLHGKKGFDRIVWAFKNVLDHSVAWLFYDLASGTNGISEGTSTQPPKPMTKKQVKLTKSGDPTLQGNHPQIIDCAVSLTHHHNIITPSFSETTFTEASSENILKEDSENLSEWLAMVALGSPRVSKDDNIDPYLSRYSVSDDGPVRTTNLVSLKWHGFVPASWVLDLFISLL
jgi:ribonuclease P/MRP protein subunit RPP40